MKKLILITSVAGLVGFAGMFTLAWFTRSKSNTSVESEQSQQPAMGADPSGNTGPLIHYNNAQPSTMTMTDRQLQTLIFEVREKIKEYGRKLKELEVREQRLQTAQQVLQEDIQKMEDLRIELAAAVALLKSEQEELLKSRVKVEKNEQANLLSIAAAYDKMAPESAGKILMNMVKNQGNGDNADDAIKILYYMTERTKAKVLETIADAEPSISVYICQKLKRMVTTE